MKRFLLSIFLFITLIGYSQNLQLAQNYFEKGDFEKALITYEDLLKTQPGNSTLFTRVIECHQQLENYKEAEKIITERYNKYKQPHILVELGYNFQLQKNDAEAKNKYQLAISLLEKNPNYIYNVAQALEKKGLYEWALSAYEKTENLNDKPNYNYQIGILYGQLGKTDMMIERFLDESYRNPSVTTVIQNQFMRFINDNPDENFTNALRKSLIIRAQKDQNIFWNQYLSWFFVQQKEYGKAFIQEKAIYKREPETFYNIVNLAELAIEDNDTESAEEIIGFVLENTSDVALQIYCHTFLLNNRIKKSSAKDHESIQANLELLLKKYGLTPNSITLQQTYAKFLTFNMKQPQEGRKVLQNVLKLPLNNFQQADIKMDLADIFLYEEKFNQASIYYSQIQEDLKNNAIAHEASLKAAKTSYFKGDFDWALNQFKVLKTASTQLIANDALEYFLLINDNKIADSSMVALQKFAKGDYLLYQNRNDEALSQFQKILIEDKDNEIISVTLLRLGQTHEILGNYSQALSYYKQIIDEHKDGIYIDEAYYYSAEIRYKIYKEKEQAKLLYEKIIFNHQDSIYFIDAQKKYRQIRGDFDS